MLNYVFDVVAERSRALTSESEVLYGGEFKSPSGLKILNLLKIWINWRTGVSIPVPLECESSALPFELVPLKELRK